MTDRPTVEANRILSVNGITSCPAEHLQDIAAAEHIKVLFRSINDEPSFGGQLVYKGKKTGILVNTCIPNSGKHNFTFAHELGHYFLRHPPSYTMDGQSGFRCTAADMDTSRNPQETEANRFAVELLMPVDMFRPLMAGAPLDYTLINSLARQFRVSKHASGNRVLEFTRDVCIIIRTSGFNITEQRTSQAAKRHLLPLFQIPQGTAAYEAISKKKNQIDFTECDPVKWLAKTNPALRLYECTRGDWEHGVATTILKW